MQFDVRRVSNGPKHHLFGFHDLVQSNAKGDLLLSLEVDDISHPPLPGETCASGVISVDVATGVFGSFELIHKTCTWNYPQGARQQWIGESDLFVCNNRKENGSLSANVCDGRERKVLETLPFPIHVIAGDKAFYFNYDRIHAVGGYGYNPAIKSKAVCLDDLPDDDGLFVGDIKTKKHELLVSLSTISVCGESHPVKSGYPHYVTHAMLNPNRTRIAFLHRYRVADGGETTRLMTIGADGSNLRCLAKGFLSHFTWIGDDELFIWGEDQRALCKFRESTYLRIPGVLQGALFAKKVMRLIRSKNKVRHVHTSTVEGKAFLRIKDVEQPILKKTAIGVLIEDGHPMASPSALHYLISDTYPNDEGDRTLMFYDVDKNERFDVEKFKMIFDKPNVGAFDWKAVQSGMDPRILKKFNREDYFFYRSGFHCDLHPRWSADGKVGYFDSVHEGTRQIYAVRKIK